MSTQKSIKKSVIKNSILDASIEKNGRYSPQRVSGGRGFALSLIMVLATVMAAFIIASVNAAGDTTRPIVLSVSPTNNEMDLPRMQQIVVVFSETMDVSSINADTFTVTQRTTPGSGIDAEEYRSLSIDGTTTVVGDTVTFTPDDRFTPDQQHGNVFTVTMTTGIKDVSGNSLSQDYTWSFTTGIAQFHADGSTSQQDQVAVASVAPVVVDSGQSPSVAIPAAATSAAPASTATSRFFSRLGTEYRTIMASTPTWVWVVVVLFLLLVITMISALISRRITNPARKKDMSIISDKSGQKKSGQKSPFGDVYPVRDIEGIGPSYSKLLRTMGVQNTQQLWDADVARLARGTGASLSTVESWQHMAELASVKDIGPQYAELLERSGVHSIEQLKSYDPDVLLALVRAKQDSLKVNIQGNPPGQAIVEHWIDGAREHKFGET